MIVNHPRASLRAANAGFGEKVFVPRRMQAATQRTENGKEAGGTNTRERLRRVALELFWEKGYRLTSTRDLATALGVKQASLYYHVKNKEELLHEICYNALQQVIEKVKAAAQRADTPIKKLGAIAQTHMVAKKSFWLLCTITARFRRSAMRRSTGSGPITSREFRQSTTRQFVEERCGRIFRTRITITR
jgi:AcrR family transcriptional regulator